MCVYIYIIFFFYLPQRTIRTIVRVKQVNISFIYLLIYLRERERESVRKLVRTNKGGAEGEGERILSRLWAGCGAQWEA